MAIFKAGDRVRNKIDGDTGTFVCYRRYPARTFFTIANAHSNRELNCTVIYDSTGGEFAEHTDSIEPIQPERNRVVAWEDVPGGRPKIAEFS